MVFDLHLLHAQMIKALAHPARLALLRHLTDGEKTATELVLLSGLSKANLSQHINLLKQEGVVRCHKRGRFCHYALADERIMQALSLLHAVLAEHLSAAANEVRSGLKRGASN